MRGTYVFKQSGEIVAVCPNLLTTKGRQQIQRFMAGRTGRLASSIGLGHGSKTPTLQDTDLVLESIRLDIGVSSPDYLNKTIIFKGTIPQTVIGTYYEIGLWSLPGGAASVLQPLLSFRDALEDWSAGTHQPDNARLSNETLLVSAATNTTTTVINNNFSVDFSQYLVKDTLSLSWYCPDENTSFVRMRLRGENTANYFEIIQNAPKRGYNVLAFNVSQLTKTGIIDLASIRSVELAVKANLTDVATGQTGGTNSSTGEVYASPLGYTGTRIYFDGFAYQPVNNEDDVLISRALVPATTKTSVAPMDVEYYLELS